MFPANNTPTKELSLWEYVVYRDQVRLGNRKVDDQAQKGPNPVIGSWPWLTNNPGDLTGDVSPRKENSNDPASYYRQDQRIWGSPILRGQSTASLQPEPGSTGLSSGNTAITGFAARHDLGVFKDIGTGRRALQEWIQKYYADQTLASAVDTHLGGRKTALERGDDPDLYRKQLATSLNNKDATKYPMGYTNSTLCRDVKEDQWEDVIDAFGVVEGYHIQKRTAQGVQYLENQGIIYECSGRQPTKLLPGYENLPKVTSMPQTTPPEIKDLLGCR